MSALTALSSELLIEVFKASDSVKDALNLSASCRRLQAIWLEHSDSIIEGLLSPKIPAYAVAVDLAITETHLRGLSNRKPPTRCCMPIDPDDAEEITAQLRSSLGERPPLRYCLPVLIHNADLCASATAGYAAFSERYPVSTKSYYFLRRLMLASEYPTLRERLYAEIHCEVQAASEDKIRPTYRLARYLVGFADDAEQSRQGMTLGKKNPQPEEEELPEDGWDYSMEILVCAVNDIRCDESELQRAVQGYWA